MMIVLGRLLLSTEKSSTTTPSTIEIDIDRAIIQVRLGVDQAWPHAC
jgi:hypothetical protein